MAVIRAFHAEAVAAPALIRELHLWEPLAGPTLKPATDIAPFVDILNEFDMILIMTVSRDLADSLLSSR